MLLPRWRRTPNRAARVSLGVGAWLLVALAAALWFQGDQSASRPVRLVALAIGLGLALLAFAVGGLTNTSLAREYQSRADMFWPLVVGHVTLAVSGVAIALVLGLPVGVLAARSPRVRRVAIPVVGVIQTVPSLALLGLLIAPLAALSLPAIGTLPALIALTLYALLPIVRNTYLGISAVDPASLDAGRGMGMSGSQLMARVEFPLAMPLVLEGLRAALVLIMGITAVMAIGGARTLGVLVFEGWGSQAADLTLLGAVPMVILAIALTAGCERSSASPSHRGSGSTHDRAAPRHQALRRQDRRQRSLARGARRRGRRTHRAVGVRQDHHASHDQPPHRAHVRPDPRPGPRRVRASAGGTAAAHRLRRSSPSACSRTSPSPRTSPRSRSFWGGMRRAHGRGLPSYSNLSGCRPTRTPRSTRVSSQAARPSAWALPGRSRLTRPSC